MHKGQIIRILSNFYTVLENGQTYVCKPRGKFRKNDLKPLVGDFCEFSDDLVITKILPRKNELVRPAISNIDQAIIVVSAKKPDFSTILLDRFLALIEHHDISPIIVVSKADLLEDSDINFYSEIEGYKKAGYHVILTSKITSQGKEELKACLKDKVTVFTGQSGVGKSSLLNILDSELELKTGEISEVLGRGKHTTRHVELFNMHGGYVADTPGFSSLELDMSDRDLAVSYHDFKKLSNLCKFRGCSHSHEPGCAVKEAVETGEVAKFRYAHYLQFLEEIKTKKVIY